MDPNYTPTRPVLRCAFAAAALAATLACAAFVDGLARGYVEEALLAAAPQHVASAGTAR
jgi:hypothetical protein